MDVVSLSDHAKMLLADFGHIGIFFVYSIAYLFPDLGIAVALSISKILNAMAS